MHLRVDTNFHYTLGSYVIINGLDINWFSANLNHFQEKKFVCPGNTTKDIPEPKLLENFSDIVCTMYRFITCFDDKDTYEITSYEPNLPLPTIKEIFEFICSRPVPFNLIFKTGLGQCIEKCDCGNNCWGCEKCSYDCNHSIRLNGGINTYADLFQHISWNAAESTEDRRLVG